VRNCLELGGAGQGGRLGPSVVAERKRRGNGAFLPATGFFLSWRSGLSGSLLVSGLDLADPGRQNASPDGMWGRAAWALAGCPGLHPCGMGGAGSLVWASGVNNSRMGAKGGGRSELCELVNARCWGAGNSELRD